MVVVLVEMVEANIMAKVQVYLELLISSEASKQHTNPHDLRIMIFTLCFVKSLSH